MFVGEIGIQRHEYLYILTFADLLLIRRGYFFRYHQQWEMARMIAHQVHYCMGVKQGDTVKTATEWVTFPWERTPDGEPADIPSELEVECLRQIMREENARAEAKTET
jgi:hypothetical protein